MDESTHLHQGARPVAPAVLSIGKLSLGQEAYYLTEVLDGAEDYYLNVGEVTGAPDSGPPVVGVRESSMLDGRTHHDEATPTHPRTDRAQAP